MSFILDALRKSESERQRLGAVAMADLPVGRRRRGQPWWVYALSALLLVNLGVLLVVLLRDRSTSQSPSTIATSLSPTTNAVTTQASAPRPLAAPNPLQEAAANPPQVTYESVPRSELDIANAVASVPDGAAVVRPDDATPTITKPVTTTQPNDSPSQDIHLDLHVYSQNPRERFVMINMHRYTEGQQLPNGANIEQITPEGVVLYQNGTRYQLSR